MSSPILSTRNLTHVYSAGTPFEKMAIRDISLDFYPSEFVGLIGHTGSGKSTFVQHLNGLLKPTSGAVLFNGEALSSSKKVLRQSRFQVGLVFQYPEYQLFEETVFQDIAFGPKNMKLSGDEVAERVREAARFVGVPEEIFEKSPLELSGGQKRRVAIAGVIAMRPQVLALDEPTAGLDPEGRESILRNLLDYHDSTGAAVLLITHDMEEIARIASRLVVFREGEVAFDGAPKEVFRHGRELVDMGLELPGAAHIALRLRELGAALPEGIYTLEALADAICGVQGHSLGQREGALECGGTPPVSARTALPAPSEREPKWRGGCGSC
ncbi:MAG: energy-coupling factor transporter ATPase [Firmicutes bacterium]|nr:energy-coupling factor transporter ATPase [Bacillota bacterium]